MAQNCGREPFHRLVGSRKFLFCFGKETAAGGSGMLPASFRQRILSLKFYAINFFLSANRYQTLA